MEVTKDLEAEITQFMNTYWDTYFNGDLDKWASFLPDDYQNIGTTKEEVWRSKQDIVDYTSNVIDHMKGMTDFRNKKTEIKIYDPYIMVHEFCDLYAKGENEWMFYSVFRLSSLLQKSGNGWQVLHQHGSYPDSKNQEGEAFAFNTLKAENVKLQAAVKNRTLELEEKSRYLEIEAALERVRARTMAMQNSQELPEAANLLFQQIQLLGMPAWSAGYCIWDEDKNGITAWMSSEGVLQPPFHAPLTKDPLFKTMRKAYDQGESFAVVEMGGDELVEHYKYMRTLPVVGEILDAIIAAGHPLPGFQIMHYCFFSEGLLLFITYERVPLAHDIFKRFTKVFEQTYTRFLDLQKAEAQAREAQIEASLERVRSRSLAMHNSEELLDVIDIISDQILQLGLAFDSISFGTNDSKGAFRFWLDSPGQPRPILMVIPPINNPAAMRVVEMQQKGIEFFADVLTKEENIEWITHLIEHSDFKHFPKKIQDYMLRQEGFWRSTFLFPNISLFATNYRGKAFSEDENAIFKRFAQVFDQTYTRFLDLQKAEAQARESEIELALERVRARTMAMQKSDELQQVIRIVYQQLSHLKINLAHAGFVVDYKPGGDWHFWIADEQDIPSKITHPWFDSVWAKQFDEAKKTGTASFSTLLNFEEKNTFYTDLLSYIPGLPKASKDFYLSCPGLAATTVLFDDVSLYIENFDGIPYSDAENNTLMRFGKVFQQTYTRFLDLQKAEAQARENQIQLALERVRARSLAMHHSSELSAVVDTLMQEFTGLQFSLTFCIINLIDPESRTNTVWAANPETGKDAESYLLKFEDYPFHHAMWDAWKRQDKRFVYTLAGEEKKVYDEYLYSSTEFKRFPEHVKEANKALPQYVAGFTFFNYSGLQTVSVNQVTEVELGILERFGKVFEQAYTRFLDLQKAEAQAKESQIQLALERVRARTMAMQKSSELGEAATLLFEQMNLLVPDLWSCGFVLCDKNKDDDEWWLSGGNGYMPDLILPHVGDTTHQNIFNAWLSGATYHEEIVAEEKLQQHYEWLMKIPVAKAAFDAQDAAGIARPIWQQLSCAFFKQGFLVAITEEPSKNEAILVRFANVFEQTYTRFLDLQKAELQAREAQIEAALERVRSRTLAMQKSDELADTASELFRQMIGLGIEPNRLYITIINEATDEADFWITDEDGSKLTAAYTSNMHDNSTFTRMYEGWKNQLQHLVIDMQGAELQNYFTYLQSRNVPFKGGLHQKRRVQHMAYFNRGFIGLASPDEQPAETIQVLERFAAVFNLTFTRFNDLKIAEAHALQAEQDLEEIKAARKKAEDALIELQATQRQLIQSEKMASLGELTAGIAHEIQNPLNFVNNFSEVSSELLEEIMEEVAKGNYEEIKAIVEDVRQNLEKINHHGKRADVIVKGMLQHSRTSSGQKEPTDINTLCDEYLRLAYHGLRAKDKSFNAEIKTDFDNSIGKINVVPQDIGRVLLNLINNAFYAVNEKQKTCQAEPVEAPFNPLVSVHTKKLNDRVEIMVSDNGNGIPDSIKEKIFQPFFTTKPTGSGTGLGLSLSYDIVKAHGGAIEVASIVVDEESGKSTGTKFLIRLPMT